MLHSHKRMLHRYFYSTDEVSPGLQPMKLKESPSEIHGEIRTLLAVMETAIIDLDYEFMLGEDLRTYCTILDLDYMCVRAAFLGMSEMIKLNREWCNE